MRLGIICFYLIRLYPWVACITGRLASLGIVAVEAPLGLWNRTFLVTQCVSNRILLKKHDVHNTAHG